MGNNPRSEPTDAADQYENQIEDLQPMLGN